MVWETDVQSQVESYQRLKKKKKKKKKKMVLDTSLLNTHNYEVRIKGKVEQSRKRSKRTLRPLGEVAIEKGTLRSPLTTVAKFTYLH